MNCDTAFDLMTDPQTAGSSALARHLETCPRCRQMQETLAPALDFLSGASRDDVSCEFSTTTGESRAGERQPVVTVEALKIAEQTAKVLAAQCETPRVRAQRLAVRGVRYSAAFAAGVFLAVTFFMDRGPAAPTTAPVEGQCTRSEADRHDIERSAAEIRRLALSCTVCHGAVSHSAADRRSTLLQSRPQDGLDWLRAFLADEALLALCDRTAVACRA